MFSKFVITSCITANLAREYLHTFGNTADVLTCTENPLGFGIRVIIFKVGIGKINIMNLCV